MLSDTPRILIVEHEPHVGSQLRETLDAAGFSTRLVASGHAVQEMDDWQPAAVLVDLRHEVHGCRQFCATLARRTDDGPPPVVLIGEASNLMKRMPLTPWGLIPTPIDDSQLVDTIRRATDELLV